MIKILTPNKDGKIELTKEELEQLLNEAKNEGKEEERNRPKGDVEKSNAPVKKPYSVWDDMPMPKPEKVWYDNLDQEARNKMFYVDYENLPRYYDNNLYEKAPYWMNPNLKMPEVTCKSIHKYEPDLRSTAEPNNLHTTYTSAVTNSASTL